MGVQAAGTEQDTSRGVGAVLGRAFEEAAAGRFAVALEIVEQALGEHDDPDLRLLAGQLSYAAARAEWGRGQLEAAVAGYEARGLRRKAAVAACALGCLYEAGLGNLLAARAWRARARRYLEGEGRCVEQGWVALGWTGCGSDDPEALLSDAEHALGLAREFGDHRLEVRALADGGLTLVGLGRVAEGMRWLDEARTDGTGLRQITHDAADKGELAWSPRGDRIAFVREPVGGGDREIYSIKPDGSGLKDLTNDPNNFDLDPAWSPDGTKIAYSGPFHPNRESVGADLWIMNANGSGQRPLHHESNGYSDGAFPAWSPDGTTIAFTANNGSGYYHLLAVPASGGQNTSLVTNTVPGGNPLDQEVDWQPRPTSKAPRTLITAVRINVRRRTATFAFRGTGPATGYRCELRFGKRRAAFTPCSSPKTYKHLTRGTYTFAVVGFGPGEPYRTPASRKFTIR